MKDAAVCKVGKECSSSYEAYSVSLSLVDEEGGQNILRILLLGVRKRVF